MQNEQPKCGIYKIYCNANDKTYIGQSCDIGRRFKEHRKRLKSQKMKHSSVYMERAWQLYGEEAFEFSIIEECATDKLNEREQYYLDLYGKEKLLNIALCAEAPARGRILSEETKQKLREANLGEKSPMYGKTHTEEARKKLSESKKGEKHWHYGKPCTGEEKLKNSLAHRGEKGFHAKLTWQMVSQVRADYENDVKSVAEMADELSMDKSTLYDIIKNVTWRDDKYIPNQKVLDKLKQGAHVVNIELVKALREEYKTSKLQLRDLAAKYGMSVSGFGKVIRNECWIDEEYGAWLAAAKKPHKKPVRINIEIARQIRQEYEAQYSKFNKELGYATIGQKYDISVVMVRKIVKNKVWTE